MMQVRGGFHVKFNYYSVWLSSPCLGLSLSSAVRRLQYVESVWLRVPGLGAGIRVQRGQLLPPSINAH